LFGFIVSRGCRARRAEKKKFGRHVMSGLGHVSCEISPISAVQPLRTCPGHHLPLYIPTLTIKTHKRTCLCQNTGIPDYQRPNTPRPRGQFDDTDGLTWRNVHGPAPILKSAVCLPCMPDSKNLSLRVTVYLTVQRSC
jgi:hypothetical protein